MSYTVPCPFCGAECAAEFVDIGVGEQQCGPFTCNSCHAAQLNYEELLYTLRGENIGLDEGERRAGWRRGVKANTCGSCTHFDPSFINHMGIAHCARLHDVRVHERQHCTLAPSAYAGREPVVPAPLGCGTIASRR